MRNSPVLWVIFVLMLVLAIAALVLVLTSDSSAQEQEHYKAMLRAELQALNVAVTIDSVQKVSARLVIIYGQSGPVVFFVMEWRVIIICQEGEKIKEQEICEKTPLDPSVKDWQRNAEAIKQLAETITKDLQAGRLKKCQ